MSRYRKKPIEVDAEQFHIKKLPHHHAVKRCVIADGKVECILQELERYHASNGRYESHAVQTTNGWVEIKDGDWIIKEMIDQGYYPCPNEVFIRTYEAAV